MTGMSEELHSQAQAVRAQLADAHVAVDDTVSPELRGAIGRALDRHIATVDKFADVTAAVVCVGSVPRPGEVPPGLLWFHTVNAGVDQLQLPRQALLTRTVGGMDVRMAEYVVAWVMSEAQNVRLHAVQHSERRWCRAKPEAVTGATALVFGAGHMGRRIGQHLRALGVEVIGVASRARSDDSFSRVSTLDEADADLPRARWVVNALPLTDRTTGYFGAELLGRMTGATFINVGRGATVNLDALESALASGSVRTAVLDVLPQEPPTDARWWSLPRTTLTSHSAAITHDKDVVEDFVAAWRSLEAGDVPALAVDRTRGY